MELVSLSYNILKNQVKLRKSVNFKMVQSNTNQAILHFSHDAVTSVAYETDKWI